MSNLRDSILELAEQMDSARRGKTQYWQGWDDYLKEFSQRLKDAIERSEPIEQEPTERESNQ